MSDPFGHVVKELAGFDYGGLASGVLNVAQTGVEQYQKSDAEDKAKTAKTTAISKSIAADVAWANAEAQVVLAAVSPTALASAQTVLAVAKQDAQTAAAALDDDGMAKRCKAAQDALKAAANAAASAPNDLAKQVKMRAWQKVADACGSSSSSDSSSDKPKNGESGFGSFFTSMHGGLPVWGWGLVGVGGVAALVLIVKAMKKR